jgi:hypothetical protein
MGRHSSYAKNDSEHKRTRVSCCDSWHICRNSPFPSRVSLRVQQSQKINRPIMGLQRCVQRVQQSVPSIHLYAYMLLHLDWFLQTEHKSDAVKVGSVLGFRVCSDVRFSVNMAFWSFEKFSTSWNLRMWEHDSWAGKIHLLDSGYQRILQGYPARISIHFYQERSSNDRHAKSSIPAHSSGPKRLKTQRLPTRINDHKFPGISK